jgi:hypothetical protein
VGRNYWSEDRNKETEVGSEGPDFLDKTAKKKSHERQAAGP